MGKQNVNKEFIKDYPVSKIIPYERNPRRNDHAVETLAKSIERVGNNDPIEINEDGVVLCGHTRLKALKKLGITKTDVLVITGLTRKQQEEYRITHNKIGEIAEWDYKILEEDYRLEELIEYGFSADELQTIDIQEDVAPPVPEKARTVRGDIYTLGEHKVMCGDSANIEDVEKLLNGEKPTIMITDPPYGITIGKLNERYGEIRKKKINTGHIINDDLKPNELKNLISVVLNNMKIVCDYECSYYVTMNGPKLKMIIEIFEEIGLPIKFIIVWVKNKFTNYLNGKTYKNENEFILLTWGKKHKSPMRGEFKTTVWRIDKPKASNYHPTMKPVKLYANALMNNSDTGDIAIDPFAGSGTMIIACEQTKRKARCMELSERYTDAIVQRWVNYTGGKVIRNGKQEKWEITQSEDREKE